MNSLLFVVAATSVAWCTQAAVLTTPGSVCTWNGHTFSEGEQYKPDPCTFCFCRDGRAACAVADCMMPSCVDPVRQPDKCCPVCPNGQNCRAFDGSIIPAGKQVKINDGTTCVCPTGGLIYLSGLMAECVSVAN
ncbi:hypothetical protein C0Q70_02136 [Pomacea canaliculata]|uniref:VWFC domain-containing protein n=1 Tax=Pomacea canaliculata TaxID=400727 RepID=A0A2T7Q1F7_POMCA|nr:von Willebrand factor C domain-containing protein 2-like [Pomacea canaliculata]PVD39502.1 hypothetical protein C0Q70_02136 [Pomacea canaliculata]